ncbi:MAG: class I SAM-dependent methyltransferase [Anaerolineales bacterium]|nr:MAG: class I SAM-dependent methyltransferase [Anaerolineales bacterium]
MSSFNSAYAGTPPWDIGRPQAEIVRLSEANEIRGRVLDVGCGTGEHVLYLAELGQEAWGVDSAPAAIEKAKTKAQERGLAANFLVGDATELQRLGRTFDTVIDSGLFHTFSDEERPLFVKSLAHVLRPGGTYYALCFSERELGPGGPRRVSRAEIRSSFQEGWKINYIREARFESSIHTGGARAWLSSITRQAK